MRSKKDLKRIVAEGMRHKARVHIGRYGVRPRVLAVYHKAYHGTPPDPTPSEIVRVKVHTGCTQDPADIIRRLTADHPSEYAGSRGDSMIFFLSDMPKMS